MRAPGSPPHPVFSANPQWKKGEVSQGTLRGAKDRLRNVPAELCVGIARRAGGRSAQVHRIILLPTAQFSPGSYCGRSAKQGPDATA